MLFLVSCNEDESIFTVNARQLFYLESEEAILPVYVEGNTQSDVLLVICHGGPGGTAMIYNEWNIFREIEERYAVVYWEQRCAGNAQGNCLPSELSVDTYTHELGLLIELLVHRYGSDKKIFLLGHSWGGGLIMSYMGQNEVHPQIRGGIVADGIHDFTRYVPRVREMIQTIGQEQMDMGNNATEWQEHIDEAAEWQQGVNEDVYKANSTAYECQTLINKTDLIAVPDVDIEALLQSTFYSDQNFLMSWINQKYTGISMFEELATMDLSPIVDDIHLPLALYWGKYDFVVPPVYSQVLFDLLPGREKEIHIFEQSDHSPMFAERDLFNDRLLDFIDRYK